MNVQQSFLNEILQLHPLAGIERNEPFLGDQPGLTSPQWVHEGPVYEVFLRAFSPAGTFDSLREKIPYLKNLGVKTIWLMPLQPRGISGRKGQFGSPYAINKFKEIDPDYGSETDLRRLISVVHEHDMKLIMDIVANHAAVDFYLYRKSPQRFRKQKSWLGRAWTDVCEFDYSHPATRTFMLDVLQYWVRHFDIDGYRCDVAGLVPGDFWEDAAARLRDIKPDFFMLAEWESAAMHLNSFHATYDWSLYALLRVVQKGEKPVRDILRWVEEKQKKYPHNSLPLRFTENHDLPRTVKQFGTRSFFPYAAILYTIFGIPLIYAGQEIGAINTPSLFERELVEWDEKNIEIYEFYRRLITLRSKYSALRSRDLKRVDQVYPEDVLVYEKYAAKENVLVIINFSENEYNLEVPQKEKHEVYVDIMKQTQIIEEKKLKIHAYSTKILKSIDRQRAAGDL